MSGIHQKTDAVVSKELESLLVSVGDAVVRLSVAQLIETLTKEETIALEHYLETEPDATMMLQHFFEHYPRFEDIFNAEVALQQRRVTAIMGEAKAQEESDVN